MHRPSGEVEEEGRLMREHREDEEVGLEELEMDVLGPVAGSKQGRP